jgi:hypothetical protein
MFMTHIHAPPNDQKIEHVWMVISSDEEGEGVCAAPLFGSGSLVPLIAADEERLESILPIAKILARESGKTIKLIKFSVREDVMEITP